MGTDEILLTDLDKNLQFERGFNRLITGSGWLSWSQAHTQKELSSTQNTRMYDSHELHADES